MGIFLIYYPCKGPRIKSVPDKSNTHTLRTRRTTFYFIFPSQVLWSFAKLVGNADSPAQELAGLMGALAEGFESEGVRGCEGGGLDAKIACDVLWSFATMGHPTHSLCETLGRDLSDQARRSFFLSRSYVTFFRLCILLPSQCVPVFPGILITTHSSSSWLSFLRHASPHAMNIFGLRFAEEGVTW